MSKIVFGKEVFTTLEELVLPQHTALIVVDVQNDFCSPGGRFAQLESSNMDMMQPCTDHLVELLTAARQAGAMIIYIQATNEPNYIYKSAPSLAWVIESLNAGSPLICIDGEWGHQIVDKVKPLPDELIIKKHRHSSFAGTELDMLLRSNGIKTAIVTGVATERCVLATVCGAIAHDYYVVVPEDCVASPSVEMHKAALLIMSGNLLKECMTNSTQIINVWRGAVAAPGA